MFLYLIGMAVAWAVLGFGGWLLLTQPPPVSLVQVVVVVAMIFLIGTSTRLALSDHHEYALIKRVTPTATQWQLWHSHPAPSAYANIIATLDTPFLAGDASRLNALLRISQP